MQTVSTSIDSRVPLYYLWYQPGEWPQNEAISMFRYGDVVQDSHVAR